MKTRTHGLDEKEMELVKLLAFSTHLFIFMF